MHTRIVVPKKNERGSAMVEFALVGVTLLFIWLSTVQIAFGMWNYHTLQYAVKTATAYASVHGVNCTTSPNNCSVNVSNIVTVFQNAAIGIPMSQVRLTLTTASGATTTCTQVSTCSSNGAWNTVWPPSSNSDNAMGKDIYLRADYNFASALAMFIPGHGSVSFGNGTGAFDFPGYSHQLIIF